TMCAAAAPANGPISWGNESLVGTPTVPPRKRNSRPAMYALSAYIAPLKIRCAIVGPRRRQNALTRPVRAAPRGPSRTTEARVAAYPGDHATRRGVIAVGTDSHTRKRTARTARRLHGMP